MKLHEIARELARLRAELAELGREAPGLQQRIQVLAGSILHLQQDLEEMRDAPDFPRRTSDPVEDGAEEVGLDAEQVG